MDRSFLVLAIAVIGAVVAFIWWTVFPATSMANVNAGTVAGLFNALDWRLERSVSRDMIFRFS